METLRTTASRNPRILLLADRPGWAYDTAARAIADRLAGDFEFRIEYVRDKPDLSRWPFDILHVFFWGETHHRDFVSDPRRVVKEVSSHRWANLAVFGHLTPEQMARRHLADAATLTATSRRLQRIFEPFREVHWCPNGFDPASFGLRRERTGPLRIGWAGNRDDSCKGLYDILEPAAAGGYEIVVAGGDVEPAQMVEFYNSIDVLCVASTDEGEPLTLIEGMACGVFPVAVDVGIVPELVRHGENGLIVERSAAAFRAAFQWCEAHLDEVRSAGRENAGSLLATRTWDAVAVHWREVFERALRLARSGSEPRTAADRTWQANLGTNDTLAQWPERAQAAARLLAELPIRTGDSVLDLGCGQQTIRRWLPSGTRYLPVDRLARTPDTQVLDLEHEFPTGRHRAAVVLGLLEYLERPLDLLSRIARAVDFCVFSLNGDPDPERRRRQHWKPRVAPELLERHLRSLGGRVHRRVDLGKGLELFAIDFSAGVGRHAGPGRRLALLDASHTSTNSGDAVITDAIRRMLGPNAFETFPLLEPLRDAQIEAVNACDAVILCGTNLYQQRFACALSEAIVRRIRVPIIPLGLGASAPIGELPAMNAGDARVVREIHDRCEVASVRDPDSLRFVERLGVQNAVLTGCPVLFHGLVPPDFAARPEGPLHLAIRARLLHVAERWLEKEIEILEAICRDLRPVLVLQSPFDVPIAEDLARRFGVEFSWDPRTDSCEPLLRSIAAAGRTAGFRLHFGMLGLSHGRAATLIGSDTRVASFCEMMGIPWHDVRSCRAEDVVRELREPAAGLERFPGRWQELRAAMAAMLDANGLPHQLGEQAASREPARVETAQRTAPRVTVLLPVHDAERYLPEAIESVLAQSFCDFELLAIDDGSRDGSAAILDAYARRDYRVRVVRRPHAGLVATLNAGLELARAELIARLDADDVALPQRLESQLARLAREPELVCIGGGFELIDEAGRAFDRAFPPCDHAAILARALRGESPISHSAATYRRDLVRRLGGYDERARWVEDLDLWLRLSEHGELANLPTLVCRVRHHERSVSERHAAEQLAQARRVAEIACRRRGLDTSLVQPRPWRAPPDRGSRQILALGRALSAWRIGERGTALRYAARALWIQPASLPLWRTLGHELKASLLRGPT
jgi:GT2 family glycosyltransferase/polysaccharide pyruvyl transferase WcaK-like protein